MWDEVTVWINQLNQASDGEFGSDEDQNQMEARSDGDLTGWMDEG